MVKEVRGIVKQNPIIMELGGMFIVEQDKEAYLIVSTDRQAIKDNIFVEQGQEIRIRGRCMMDKELKGVIITEEAKITLEKSLKGGNEYDVFKKKNEVRS